MNFHKACMEAAPALQNISMWASHKAKDESILESEWMKPSFLQEGSRAGGELRGVWFSRGSHPRRTGSLKNLLATLKSSSSMGATAKPAVCFNNAELINSSAKPGDVVGYNRANTQQLIHMRCCIPVHGEEAGSGKAPAEPFPFLLPDFVVSDGWDLANLEWELPFCCVLC